MNLKSTNLRKFRIPLILFSTIIVGFVFNEDSLGGAKNDFYSQLERTFYLKEDLLYHLFNYDDLENRHSPIFLVFSSIILNSFENVEFLRIIHLFLPILIYFFFYKCLKIRFNKIDSSKLAFISSLIFISPTIRSYSIWPDSYIYGLLFFLISTYYFLLHRFQKYSFLNIFYNVFYLSISSYFMPIFSIFSIYFFFNFTEFFFKKKFFYKIPIVIFLNLLLAFPAFYYIFYLDINFLRSTGEWGLTEKTFSFLNFSNKFFYSSSIIFFHLIPFFLIFFDKLKTFKSIIKTKNFILIFLLLIITYFFSNYENIYDNLGGGGIFYRIFNEILNVSELQLLLIIPISLFFVFLLQNILNNYLIFLILLFSNIQLTIYHNYFEPIIYIVILTLVLNTNLNNEFFSKKNLNILILFNIFFLTISIIK